MPVKRMRIVRWAVLASMLGAGLTSACATAISGSADNIARLELAKTSNPNSEAVARNLGIAYFKATPPRYNDARASLTQAVSMDQKDGVAALYLGLTAEAQNDLPAAKTAYESYLAVGKTRGVKNQISERLAVIDRKVNEEQAKRAVAQEQALSAVPGPPNTVAVMPFTFTGADTSLKPLERGMADLVTTDLSRASALKVLERQQLQALLDEIQLQQSAGIQSGTGVRAGKILQAGRIVGGSISQLGPDQLRATASVTNVQTSALQGNPTPQQSTIDQLFDMEKRLVLDLFANLNVTLTTAERNAIEQRPTRSMAAFLSYSRGLELEDQGRYDEASRSFDNALRLDPGFVPAQQKSAETHAVVAGAAVNAGTVESGLRGTTEGAAVTAAAAGMTTSGSSAGGGASSVADGLNPSVAGTASGGSTTTTTQPTRDASAGTGGNNPTAKTAKVTIVIKQP
ncbi:MAG: CsgG/HfaB family protein [Gemmatimonadaceae bacterium]